MASRRVAKNLIRLWLFGGSTSAGGPESLDAFGKSISSRVLLRFGQSHFVHMLFQQAGNGARGVFLGELSPDPGPRSGECRHVSTLSARFLRHVSLPRIPTVSLA